MRQRAAELIHRPNAAGKVSLPDLLQELGQRSINELHLEAGHLLNTSFLRESLVDEVLLYQAPRMLGQGRGLSALGPLEDLGQSLNWRFVEVKTVGEDLRVRMMRA